MIRRTRKVIGLLLIGGLIAAMSAFSGESASATGGLGFRKEVALKSFSPLRTFVSDAYSLKDGTDPPGHEWQGEPVIDVDSQNNVFIGTTCCVGPSSPVWGSYDNGRTFHELQSPGNFREWFTPGSEGTISHDNSGHVFFADTYAPGLVFSSWANHGRDWQYSIPTNGVIPGLNDRPWLSWSKKALYLYVNYGAYVQIYYSTDQGLTWQTNGPMTFKGDLSGQPFFPGDIASDRETGTLWVDGLVPHGDPYPNGDTRYAMASAVSNDRGASYRDHLIATAERKSGFAPQFSGATAVDNAGNGYTTWATWDSHGCDVYYAASTDEGRTWRNPVKVNSSGGCSTFPWIAAHKDGSIAVVWYQTPYNQTITKDPSTSYQDKVPAKADWYMHAATITGAHTASPSITRTQVDTNGALVDGPLGRKLWDFFQVAIGPDGRMNIAYAKLVNGAPQAYYTKNTAGPQL